jgi:hypothetical protein
MICCPLVTKGTYFLRYFSKLESQYGARGNEDLPAYVRVLLNGRGTGTTADAIGLLGEARHSEVRAIGVLDMRETGSPNA